MSLCCRYSSLGASLLFTMITYPVGNRILPTMSYLSKSLAMLLDMRTGKFLTTCFTSSITHQILQEDLNELYIGHEFPIESQFGSIMAVVFCCLTFSAGMPLMYVICFLALCIVFHADKVR